MIKNKTRALIECSILVAITVVMAILSLSVPFCFFLLYALPVPTAIAIYRHDLKYGSLCVITSSLITGMLLGAMSSLSVLSIIAFISPALGIGFKKFSPVRNLLITMVAAIFSIIIGIAATFIIMKVNIFTDISNIFDNAAKMTTQIYQTMGITGNNLTEQTKQIEEFSKIITITMPSIVLLSALMISFIDFILTQRIIKRLFNPQLENLPPFDSWRLPIWFALLFGFSLIGLYWGSSYSIENLYNCSLNLNYFSSMFCRIQGLSLFYFFLKYFNVKPTMRKIITLFVFFSPLMQFLMYFGLFDMFFDYRRRFINYKNNRQL